MAIKPPIFLDCTGDLNIFPSVEAAAASIEPEDIEALRVYDSEGRLLQPVHLPPDDWFSRTFGTPGRKVGLVPVDEEPQHAAELATAIRQFLGWMRYPAAQLERDSLERLVEISQKYVSRC